MKAKLLSTHFITTMNDTVCVRVNCEKGKEIREKRKESTKIPR
jgi:hypothetical protein